MKARAAQWWRARVAWLERPGLLEPTRVFRVYFALWMMAFYLPRVPHLDELIVRPVLREPVLWLRMIDDPAMPLWMAQLLVVTLLLSAGCVAAGFLVRPAYMTMTVMHSLLFMQDQANQRAYGMLALSLAWLFAAAPFEAVAPGQRGRRANRWATHMVMLQFAVMYGFAAAAKLTASGGGWLDGSVIDRIFRAPEFGRFGLSALYVSWSAVPDWIAKAIAWGTIATEGFIAVALWYRRSWRWAALAVIGLHLGLMLSLRVSILFHLLMIGHLVLFVPDREWLRWRRKCTGYWRRRRASGLRDCAHVIERNP